MSRLSVIVEDLQDWADFYPSADVMTLEAYLSEPTREMTESKHPKRRVINLCRDHDYLSTGYYCSLLAEARGHRVVPGLQSLGDYARKRPLIGVSQVIEAALNDRAADETTYSMLFYFGKNSDEDFAKLGKQLFDQYSMPILQILFIKKAGWKIKRIKSIAITALTESERALFAQSLDSFSGLIWRKPKKNWVSKYELAILVDSQEKMPPSDAGALKRFIAAAKRQGVFAQCIEKTDYYRLAEFDGLFIRTTTAVNHYTYQFARRAEQLGLVVIDDSVSILRCTNKIFLAKMFETHHIPVPKTQLLSRQDLCHIDQIIEHLQLPIILKIPDGAFSIGVHKIESTSDLRKTMTKLLRKSSFLIAQSFCYTDYDWRIGVLNGRAIYACRYYMAKNHWAIYKHESVQNPSFTSGGFDSVPMHEVPKKVIKVALDATKRIGKGLYGVDLKQRDQEVLLIEVNDNPSIESGVEDQQLGDGLYDCIIQEFCRRF